MSLNIVNGWLQGVKQVISPYYNDRPANEEISLIVIHNISLPPNQYGGPYVEQLFTGKLDPNEHPYFATIYQLEVSSHLFIRRDGQIIQFVPFDKRAWHAGQSSFEGRENCNNFSIGIEMEGCDTDDFTDYQYQQLAAVTLLLQHTYGIKNITGHSDIAPERKTDPGPCFNWQYYRKLIDELSQAQKIVKQLELIKLELQNIRLWQTTPPPTAAFLSQEPFAIDTMQSHEWLQWIFIPRILALIDAKTKIPTFALHPYFEEALKEHPENTVQLLYLIKQLDKLSTENERN
ncbi:1,6-anhydro-N-acetylmuramyl-L-alanine amidase AmpD [Gilliamella sp. B3464]|nr:MULTISPECIES: 1,6-anhydro-N-acetylmuramyl-L-alanine amidase AmpD [unclassified Gilliamella]MCX8712777.1 1,6-anhydro-N-acetylmuramyl-L-alanine amidase AmpD [Gilliamella sp. B3468]MCX8751880.1 1,6-anhydro-N-acetylmuramyl-L-alanine amidase AmpD [Gilliamella sp. B3464]